MIWTNYTPIRVDNGVVIMTFTEALKSGNTEYIRRFPKADLYGHFVLGGSREYLFSKTGYEIKPITKPRKQLTNKEVYT